MKEHTIKQDRLIALLKAEAKLERLEAGGVDNWRSYGEALNFEEDDYLSYDDMCKAIDRAYND